MRELNTSEVAEVAGGRCFINVGGLECDSGVVAVLDGGVAWFYTASDGGWATTDYTGGMASGSFESFNSCI